MNAGRSIFKYTQVVVWLCIAPPNDIRSAICFVVDDLFPDVG